MEHLNIHKIYNITKMQVNNLVMIFVTQILMSSYANAQQYSEKDIVGIAAKLTNIKLQLNSIATLISQLSVVVGISLVASGIIKLKDAADSQGQRVSYGQGVWRLIVGSALCADFEIANVMKGTITGTNGEMSFAPLQ